MKKSIIIIVSTILIIFGVSIILLTKPQPSNTEPSISQTNTIKFKENLIFEINSELNILSLIENSNEIEIKDEIIDTSIKGEKDITIKYNEEEYIIKINIVDTMTPTIEFEPELSTTIGEEIDLLQNVKITDNSKEEIKATIEGDYNFNKSGEYKLKYVAIDSSNNKVEKEFILKVKDKISTPNNNSNNNSSNTSTPNNNSNNNSSNTSTPNNNSNNNSTNPSTPSTDNNTSDVVKPTVTKEYRQQQANQMITLINQARKENGLSELKLNTSLEASAKIRSKELVTLYSHTRPNNTSALTAINIDYVAAGENIAAGQKSVEDVFEAWMNSEGHRANILNENYTDIGISWYYDSETTYQNHWVQLFVGIEEDVKEYRQQDANEMLKLINETRKQIGLSELKSNTSLENSAKIRAKELVEEYGINRPDGSSPYTAITINYTTAYQNIVSGYEDASTAFNIIKNLSGPRDIILDENCTEIGITLYYDSKSEDKYYWVMFVVAI